MLMMIDVNADIIIVIITINVVNIVLISCSNGSYKPAFFGCCLAVVLSVFTRITAY